MHQRGDAYVSLAHAEGWGLGAFDAAGRDKPVMMTGYGGPLDFLPRHLAHLIDYDLVPVEVGPTENRLTYRHDHRWAQPHLDQAVQALKKNLRRTPHPRGHRTRPRLLCAHPFHAE